MKIKNTANRIKKYIEGKSTIEIEREKNKKIKEENKVDEVYKEKYKDKSRDELIEIIYYLASDNLNLIRINEHLKNKRE